MAVKRRWDADWKTVNLYEGLNFMGKYTLKVKQMLLSSSSFVDQRTPVSVQCQEVHTLVCIHSPTPSEDCVIHFDTDTVSQLGICMCECM